MKCQRQGSALLLGLSRIVHCTCSIRQAIWINSRSNRSDRSCTPRSSPNSSAELCTNLHISVGKMASHACVAMHRDVSTGNEGGNRGFEGTSILEAVGFRRVATLAKWSSLHVIHFQSEFEGGLQASGNRVSSFFQSHKQGSREQKYKEKEGEPSSLLATAVEEQGGEAEVGRRLRGDGCCPRRRVHSTIGRRLCRGGGSPSTQAGNTEAQGGALFELGSKLQVGDVSIIHPGAHTFRRAAASTAGQRQPYATTRSAASTR
jgi:hypothetical protein